MDLMHTGLRTRHVPPQTAPNQDNSNQNNNAARCSERLSGIEPRCWPINEGLSESISEIKATEITQTSAMTAPKTLQAHCARAVELADIAHLNGSFGVGAVLTHEGKPLAEAANRVIDPARFAEHGARHTLHAEMQLLNWYGSQQLHHKNVPPADQLTVITSLAPCLMCLSRLMKTGIGEIQYIAQDEQAGITELNAATHLPRQLARDAREHITGIGNATLKYRSSELFSKTCNEIRERAGGVAHLNPTATSPRSTTRKSARLENTPSASAPPEALRTPEGNLTTLGTATVRECFARWDELAPMPRAAILSPGNQFSVMATQPKHWPSDLEYNLMRDLVLRWDALAANRPSLRDCIVVTNGSFDVADGNSQEGWDRLHTIGVLGSTAEGAVVPVVTNQTLSASAKAHISALPVIYHNLKIQSLAPSSSPAT